MSGSAFAVTHHAFSSGAGRTSDGNGSHASTLKSPSYTKSVSWQHHPRVGWIIAGSVDGIMVEIWSYHALFWLAIGMLGIAMICLLFIKDI